MKLFGKKYLIVLALILTAASNLSAQGKNTSMGDVVLVNGANDPWENFTDFYQDLKDGRSIFSSWHQDILTDDGSKDASGHNEIAVDEKGEFIFGEDGLPVMRHSEVPGARPATLDNLKKIALRFAQDKSNKPIVFYFTDHGDHGASSLMGDEDLTVDELKKLMHLIPTSRKVIFIHDNCFSASMFGALFNRKNGLERPNTCAISVAAENEYSESGQSIMLHAAKKDNFRDFASVIHDMRFEPKDKMSSTALGSSDKYLQNYFEKHRKQKIIQDASGVPPTCFLDENDDDFNNKLKKLNGISQALLRDSMEEIQKDIEHSLEGLNGASYSSYEELLSTIAALKKNVAEAENVSDHASAVANVVYTNYVKYRMGPEKFAEYQEEAKLLDVLHEKYDTEKKAAKKIEILQQIGLTEQKYKPLQEQVEAIKLGAKENHGLSDFHDYIVKNYDETTIAKAKAADTELSDLMKAQRPLLSLSLASQEALALKQMVAASDYSAINTFLSLKNCEATPIKSGG